MTTNTNIPNESNDRVEKRAILGRLRDAKKRIGHSTPRIPVEEPLWVLKKFEQLLNFRLHMVVNQMDDNGRRVSNPAIGNTVVEFLARESRQIKGVLSSER